MRGWVGERAVEGVMRWCVTRRVTGAKRACEWCGGKACEWCGGKECEGCGEGRRVSGAEGRRVSGAKRVCEGCEVGA